MEPFATRGDLESYMGRTLDATRAELMLDLASTEIRGYLRQQVNRNEADAIVMTGTGAGGERLLLPELPVWSVDSVTETGHGATAELVAGTDYRLEAGHDARFAMLVRLGGRAWSYAVALTYDHGYDVPGGSGGAEHPLPDVFRTRTLSIAARALGNPAGHRQETIGRYSYTAGGSGDSLGLTLTVGDQDALAAFLPGTRAGARG